MKAMPEPKIVAAKTHRPADLLQGAVVSFDRILASSQGCLTILAISGMMFLKHDADYAPQRFCISGLIEFVYRN
jgi:hypothetical protein